MSKKTVALIAGILVGGAMTGALIGFGVFREKEPAVQAPAVPERKPAKAAGQSAKRPQRAVKKAAGLPRKPRVEFTNAVPPGLQQAVKSLRAALDSENRGQIVEAAKQLLASERKDIRVEAADALCYAGWEGLSLLTSLLIDQDPDVAESARNSFEDSLFEMDNAKMKGNLLSVAAEVAAPVDPAYFSELLMSYSMEATDNQTVTLAGSLYNESLPDESKQAIFQAIQDVTFSDRPITTIEQGQQAIDKWRNENAEWIKIQDSSDWESDF